MADDIRPVRFDTSLPILVQTVIGVLGDKAFDTGRAFRDPFGRVGYVTSVAIDQEKASALKTALAAALDAFAYDDGTVIGPDDFPFDRLWAAPTRWERIELEGKDPVYVHIADRRIVGQDWLLSPADATGIMPPRLVFWSVKGGGGRSTALCVLAAHLAQNNYNVLVVDADIEAPGLGAMLLDKNTRPPFGLIDALADWGLTDWSDEALAECVAASMLTQTSGGQGGIIDVVPAVGAVTLKSPENMIAKLSRAFLEKPKRGGEPETVRNQLRQFIDRITALPGKRYDAVLIDARAGLAEISASALGLGANVLVFGVNQTQTFEDFSYLFAHLSRLPVPTDADKDWRRQFRFVEAKADPQTDGATFRERLYDVLADFFYEADEGDDPFTYSLDDEDGLHQAMRINFDFPYMRFDPVVNAAQLREDTYRAAFAAFLKDARAVLGLSEVN
jgi:MinD-like ATPase involved in chromosome partitioning or flagellar assembly